MRAALIVPLACLLVGCSPTPEPTPTLLPTPTVDAPAHSTPPDVSGTATVLWGIFEQTRAAETPIPGLPYNTTSVPSAVVAPEDSEPTPELSPDLRIDWDEWVSRDCESMAALEKGPPYVSVILLATAMLQERPRSGTTSARMSDAEAQMLREWLDGLLDDDGELCGVLDVDPEKWRDPPHPPEEPLKVEFKDLFYKCRQTCITSEETNEAWWGYRSLQVMMVVENDSYDLTVPGGNLSSDGWAPTSWTITNGMTTRETFHSWQWIEGEMGNRQRTERRHDLGPGARGMWVWEVFPLHAGEWVSAIEFIDPWDNVYGIDLLRPMPGRWNYVECGDPKEGSCG